MEDESRKAEQRKEERRDALSGKEALQMLQDAPDELLSQMAEMHSSEVAGLLMACASDDERLSLITHLPDELVGETLLELPEGMQEDLLSMMHPDDIGDAVEHMDSDDAADLLQAADEHVAHAVIQGLEPDERREIEPLMAHDEESAGGLMQVELFKVRHDWKVEKVFEVLRRFGREIENLNYVYVVDDDGVLVGVLPLHVILFSEPDVNVLDVAKKDFPYAMAGEDQEKVAQIFEKFDVLALPVVDENHVLIGRITADDILDVVREEATEDMFRLAGLSDEDDLSESVATTARRRGMWLGVNLLTAIAASLVVSLFEATISQIVALAVLMPIVASMGGIAGTQTLTVIVRGIALGRVTFVNSRRTLIKEVSVGLVSGIMFAAVISVIASYWFPDWGYKLGLVIGAAMLINLFAAGFAGALVPLVLQRLSIDPALASGTILTTVTDVVGFFTFLGLATVFLL